MSYLHDEAQQVLPEVLRAARVERAVLIGHSDGGSIASIYAGTNGAHLGGLVTLAAHFFVEDFNIESIRQIRIAYDTTDLRDRLARYHCDVEAAFGGWNGAWLDPRFRAFDITGLLPGIRVPILALQGADDPYGTDAQLKVFASSVRAPITTRLIARARHAPHLEAPDDTLDAITAFVARLRL